MKEYKFTRKNRKTGNTETCGYMKYNAAENENSHASLYFYGDICGESWLSEWYPEDKAPQDVADFLNELDGSTTPLDVYVNSGGGDVFGGIAIYNILKRYQGEKTAHIDGIAASIAGIIPFACDKVIAPKYAQIMLHKPWSCCMGNADDMKKCIESLNICEQSIIDIYAENAVNGTTAEKIKSMIDRETWLTCDKASQYFNIQIEDTEPVAACTSDYYSKYQNTPESIMKSQTIVHQNPEDIEKENHKRKLQLELDCLSL